MRIPYILPASIAGLWALSGCTIGGSSTVAAENDRLRREVIDLNSKITALEGERAELVTKLGAAAGGMTAEAREAVPVVTEVEIGSLSGFTPSDRSKPAIGIDVYVSPKDGRDRFMQGVGTLRVSAFAVGSDAPLAGVTLSPRQLREAYRSGLTGTHYTVELPLAAAITRDPGPDLLIRVEFDDAVTGKHHRAERTFVRR